MSTRALAMLSMPVLTACLAMPPRPDDPGPGSGSGSGSGADASTAMTPFGCLGNPAPTTFAPTASLSGTVTTLDTSSGSLVPVSSVFVSLYVNDDGSPRVVEMDGPTPMNGKWSLGPVALTGVHEHYVMVTLPMPTDRSTFVYPAPRLAHGYGPIEIFAPRTATLNSALSALGKTQDAMRGLVHVRVVDCLDQPVDNAVVTATQTPANTPVGEVYSYASAYLGPGNHYVLNVPAGQTKLTVTYNNMTFLVQTVPVSVGATTIAIVRPGY